jgi:hypothetical protein
MRMFAGALPPEPVFGVPGVSFVPVAVVVVCAAAEPATMKSVSAAVVIILFAVIRDE